MGTCCGIRWKCHNWHRIGWFSSSQMSLSRAEGRRQLESAPLSPAEPSQAAQTAADISFLLALRWCRRLTPCTCLFKGFVFSSSNKPNHDCLGLSLVFLPPHFASLQSYSVLQLLSHRLWAIQLEIWCKLKVLEGSVIIHLAVSQRSEP